MKKYFGFSVAILTVAFLWTLAVLESQNSLAAGGHWRSTKEILEMLVYGGPETYFSRAPISNGQLNLGTYYGFQEILNTDNREVESVEFNFQISDFGYLDILYNLESDSYSAVRVSRDTDISSATYTSDWRQEFKEWRSLKLPELDERRHHAILSSASGSWTLQLDKAEPIHIQPMTGRSGFGFRNGKQSVLISGISIHYADGSTFSENFLNLAYFSGYFLWSLFLILMFCLFLYLVQWRRKEQRSEILQNQTEFLFKISALLFVWCLFDFFYVAPREVRWTPQGSTQMEPSTIDFEHARYVFFKGVDHWYRQTMQIPDLRGISFKRFGRYIFCEDTCDIAKDLPEGFLTAPKKSFRVVLLGGSMVRGDGANKFDDGVFILLHRYLQKQIPKRTRIQSFFSFFFVEDVEKIVNDYESGYSQFKPDLLIVNMLWDNSSMIQLNPHLEKLFSLANKQKTKVIYLTAPVNAQDFTTNHDYYRYDALKALAAKYQVSVVDLRQSMISTEEIFDLGNPWWDEFHLSSYGHQIIFDELSAEAVKYLPKR